MVNLLTVNPTTACFITVRCTTVMSSPRTEQALFPIRPPRSPTRSMSRPVHSPIGPRNRLPRSPVETTPRDSIPCMDEPTPAYHLSPVRSESGLLPSIEELVIPPPPPDLPSATHISPPKPPVARVIPKPATLVAAPTLSFDAEPLKWKALPHEAALCESTFLT